MVKDDRYVIFPSLQSWQTNNHRGEVLRGWSHSSRRIRHRPAEICCQVRFHLHPTMADVVTPPIPITSPRLPPRRELSHLISRQQPTAAEKRGFEKMEDQKGITRPERRMSAEHKLQLQHHREKKPRGWWIDWCPRHLWQRNKRKCWKTHTQVKMHAKKTR